MYNVIINGASGFIGSHLLDYLLEMGKNVFVLTRDPIKFSNRKYQNLTLIKYDSENYSSVKDHFKNVDIDVFFNMAWAGVSPEYKNDVDLQISNIGRTVKAAAFASEINCKLFVSAGTVAEYVFSKDVMDVNAKQTPNDIYGASKVATHYFLDVFTRKNKLPFIWCIVPSAFGEGRTDNNIITYTIRTLLRGERPSYGNLEQMWDFLYVKEIAKALYLIGEKGIPGKVYGIGSGVYKPLKEYMTIIRDIINPKLELGIGDKPELSYQTYSSCVNIDDLTKDTGFIPEIQFEEGIKRTIDWFRNNVTN